MKIIAFGASNSQHSINKKLATFATTYFKNHETEILDLNDYEMPIYSIDRQGADGVHPLAVAFADKIRQADFVMISFAEYNSGYTSAFKNIFDWVSRIQPQNIWTNKNMFLMSTSNGGRGGISALTMATTRLPFDGAKILDTFSLPNFHDNFDTESGITNSEFLKVFESKIFNVKSIIENQ